MKTFVVRPAPRLIHALRQNPLWIRSGSRRCLRVLYEAPVSPSELTGVAQLQLSIVLRQSCFSKLLVRQDTHPKSLSAVMCAPSQTVLFPDAEQRQG